MDGGGLYAPLGSADRCDPLLRKTLRRESRLRAGLSSLLLARPPTTTVAAVCLPCLRKQFPSGQVYGFGPQHQDRVGGLNLADCSLDRPRAYVLDGAQLPGQRTEWRCCQALWHHGLAAPLLRMHGSPDG